MSSKIWVRSQSKCTDFKRSISNNWWHWIICRFSRNYLKVSTFGQDQFICSWKSVGIPNNQRFTTNWSCSYWRPIIWEYSRLILERRICLVSVIGNSWSEVNYIRVSKCLIINSRKINSIMNNSRRPTQIWEEFSSIWSWSIVIVIYNRQSSWWNRCGIISDNSTKV